MATFNEIDFEKYLERLKLTEAGAAYVREVRKSAPERAVQGGQANVSGTVPSRKMGHTVQYEGRTTERAVIYLMENDPNVLEFWDQPKPKIKVRYELASGEHRSDWYTPDFLVFERSACGWVECKTLSDLEAYALRSHRYQQDKDKRWHSPCAEKVAAEYGLFYRIEVADFINRVLIQNFEYLDSFFRKLNRVDPEIVSRLKNAVHDTPGILLRDLQKKFPNVDIGDIYSLVATDQIFVDLSLFSIEDEARHVGPARVRVFRDRAMARALRFVDQYSAPAQPKILQLHEGAHIRWGKREMIVGSWINGDVLLIGDEEVRLSEQTVGDLLASGEMQITSAPDKDDTIERLTEFLRRCSMAALSQGEQRFAIFSDPTQFRQLPERTREHWRAYVREFEAEFPGFEQFGLVPRRFKCGRKQLNLPNAIEEVLEAAFGKFEEKNAISRKAWWTIVRAAAEERKITSQLCHRKTAEKWLRARITMETIEKREGATVAKAKAPPMTIIHGASPNGRWPWDKAYIDHTKVDLRLLLPNDMAAKFDPDDDTLRPWLSVMIDGYSRKVIAFVLDYNAPSNKTCMLLIRECVRIHRYLPRILGMDGGKEFRSIYFRSLMALCKIVAEYRPPRRPRFGAQIERWFQTANTQLFHQLLGNTKCMRNVRQVTSAIDPSNLAVWTLETLDETVGEFCYELYNKNFHSGINCSPNEKYDIGMKQHGHREERRFEYTEDFIKWTLPSTKKGTTTVAADGTISVFGFSYAVPEAEPGMKLQTKYDPCNVSRVYVYLNRQWTWVKCAIHEKIDGMSEKQREILSKALRAEQKAKGARQDASESHFGKFLETNTAKEAALAQKKKDAALNRVMKARTQGAETQESPGAEAQNPTPQKTASAKKMQLPPRKPIRINRTTEGFK